MRRIFWVAAGLGAGVSASVMTSRWMKRKTEVLAPANLGRELKQGASDLGRLVGAALSEGRAAAREREAGIRASLA